MKAHTKGFAMTTIVIAVLALIAILVLMGLAAKIIPPVAKNFFESMGKSANEYVKRFLGIDFGWGEKEEEEIEPGAIQEEYMLAFQGVYEAFMAGEIEDAERCLIEYPKMPNLKKNAIAFEKDGKKLKVLFIDDQGKRLEIEGFPPLKNLTPCFVAGTTKDGQIVAKNFYENWWIPVGGGGGAGGGEEYVLGDVELLNRDARASVPDTLKVTKVEDNPTVGKGTLYHIRFNPTFLYKADDKHICFIPEFHGRVPFLDRDCRGEKQGLAYACFESIREKIPCCAEPTDEGTCELEIEEKDGTRPPGPAAPPPIPSESPQYKTRTAEEEKIKNKILVEAEKQGVDWRYALGIAYLEHNGALVHGVTSSAGAIGLFQVMPFHVGRGGTCEAMNLYDLDDNIECGIKILKGYYVPGRAHFHDDDCRDVYYGGWDRATRRYVGWACMKSSSSCGTMCVLRHDHYVELVQCYIEQFDNPSEIRVCELTSNKDVYYTAEDGERHYTYTG